jgi:superfamily II DNA or RNA helicase
MKFKFSDDKSKLILTQATNNEIHQLKIWLNKYVTNYRFKQKFKLGVWDGKIDHFRDGYIRFGLWQELVKCCKEYEYKFDAPKNEFPFDTNIQKTDVEKFCQTFYKDHRVNKTAENPTGDIFTPYDHQIEAVFKILKFKFGLIEVATAGGKSLILSTFWFYYLKNINPKGKLLIIVPNVSLVTQFYDDMVDYNKGFYNDNKTPLDIKIMEFMSDKPRKIRDGEEPNVCIGTYQSLIKYPEKWLRQFDVIATDESHTAQSASLEKILSATFGAAKYRFGLSGTYPLENTAEFLSISSLMGPKLCKVGTRELIDKKIISDVKIKALILNHNDKTFADDVFLIKKSGNGARAFQLEKEYIQKSIARRDFVTRLILKFTQNSMLLFHNTKYGEELYDFFRNNIPDKDFYYIDGSTPSEKRSYIFKQMNDTSGKVKILISSYGTTSTGISIKAICNVVFMDSFKSDKIVRQSIGRGLRLHKDKTKLIVFDIVDVFHKSYKNILYKHYEVRKNDIYKRQDLPFDEIKIML